MMILPHTKGDGEQSKRVNIDLICLCRAMRSVGFGVLIWKVDVLPNQLLDQEHPGLTSRIGYSSL